MSAEPQLFRINPESKESEKIAEVDFARLGFQERWDIQEWVANNPGILGDDLLIIGKEFSGFDRTNERLDLLAVDSDGKLVIIELKRDDSGSDAHWQAIKYASYFRHAEDEDIVSMLAAYKEVSEEDAGNMLLQHLGTDDFNSLNHDQRIILASHRFAPEVTSAVLWLNEKSPGDDLITCVQLVPYMDSKTDALYVQANTIIPIPGVEDYLVGVSDAPQESSHSRNNFAANLKKAYNRNRNDEVTHFLRNVSDIATRELPIEIRPDMKSRWAGRHADKIRRYYHLWYSQPPWHNWGMFYRIDLSPKDDKTQLWEANVGFQYGSHFSDDDIRVLESKLASIRVHDDQVISSGDWGGHIAVKLKGNALDDSFATTLGDMFRRFIEVITPEIKDFENESNN